MLNRKYRKRGKRGKSENLNISYKGYIAFSTISIAISTISIAISKIVKKIADLKNSRLLFY